MDLPDELSTVPTSGLGLGAVGSLPPFTLPSSALAVAVRARMPDGGRVTAFLHQVAMSLTRTRTHDPGGWRQDR